MEKNKIVFFKLFLLILCIILSSCQTTSNITYNIKNDTNCKIEVHIYIKDSDQSLKFSIDAGNIENGTFSLDYQESSYTFSCYAVGDCIKEQSEEFTISVGNSLVWTINQ
jgi:hypothetical protein